jgi:hypothetical protein
MQVGHQQGAAVFSCCSRRQLVHCIIRRYNLLMPVGKSMRPHNKRSGPRFHLIENWRGLLLPVLQAQIEWYHKQEVTRVLERDPRSYVLESLLFKSEDWAPR